MPTPEEIDRLSDAMLGKPKCDQCGKKCKNFSALVAHLAEAHPGNGDPRPQG